MAHALRAASRLAAVLALLFWPSTQGRQGGLSEYNVPDEVTRCMKALGSDYGISGRINPFYLRADFDGDAKLDHAVLVRKGDQNGFAVCWGGGGKPILLGAGVEFNETKTLNFDAWQVHPRTRKVDVGVGEGRPPSLAGDAILLIWEERGSGLVYWSGKRFRWYQQGN
jgi:hypothetical protein